MSKDERQSAAERYTLERVDPASVIDEIVNDATPIGEYMRARGIDDRALVTAAVPDARHSVRIRLADGTPMGVFTSYRKDDEPMVSVWEFAPTEFVRRNPVTFCRWSRAAVRDFWDMEPPEVNTAILYVLPCFMRSGEWIRRVLGGTYIGAVVGIGGIELHYFRLIRPDNGKED